MLCPGPLPHADPGVAALPNHQVYVWGSAANGRLGCSTKDRLAVSPAPAGRRRRRPSIAPVPSDAQRQTVPFLLDSLTHGTHVNAVVRWRGWAGAWPCVATLAVWLLVRCWLDGLAVTRAHACVQAVGGAHTVVACVPYNCAQTLKRPVKAHPRTSIAFGPGLCVTRGEEGSMGALRASTEAACKKASSAGGAPAAATSSGALFTDEWHEFTVQLRSQAGKDVGVGGDSVSVEVEPLSRRRDAGSSDASEGGVETRVRDNGDGSYSVG